MASEGQKDVMTEIVIEMWNTANFQIIKKVKSSNFLVKRPFPSREI